MTKALLPLEVLLRQACESFPNDFPYPGQDYFGRYYSVKEWLGIHVYPHIGSGLSAGGGIYTSHGSDHFDEVIRYAGLLIGAEENCMPSRIAPYELYVLLMSILLHDAGNVFGRDRHEKRPFELLSDMGELAGSDNFEKRAIALVAEAHGGMTKNGDKDTISNLYEQNNQGHVSFRGRLIAAILRFADEICEHRGRGARILLNRGALPPESEIFHLYAESITAVRVDRKSKTINITYDVSVSDATRRWGKNNGNAYITEEILLRLEKMNLERVYCMRFMYEVVTIQRIAATVSIVDRQFNVLEQYAVTLEDLGYPVANAALLARHPDLAGSSVCERFKDSASD